MFSETNPFIFPLNVRNGKKYRAYTEIFMVKGTNGENIPVQEMFYTDKKGKKVIARHRDELSPH